MRSTHLLKHWSSTQKVVTLSSGEAELAGVVKGTGEGLGVHSIAQDLGVGAELHVYADSAAAMGICNRSGIGKVRHLAVGELWVQERVGQRDISLHKVPGEENPADLLTKHLDQGRIRHYLALVGTTLELGRAATAPRLTAEIETSLATLISA